MNSTLRMPLSTLKTGLRHTYRSPESLLMETLAYSAVSTSMPFSAKYLAAPG